MTHAPNLVLVGPMGAGKSSIGKRLAERFGLQFADADRDIELRTGASVGTIFDCEGEAGFRARESAARSRWMRRTLRRIDSTSCSAAIAAAALRRLRL